MGKLQLVVITIALAITTSGCSALRTKWAEGTPAERTLLVGLVAASVWLGGGFFVNSPRPRECPSGQQVTCPPELRPGVSCTCQ